MADEFYYTPNLPQNLQGILHTPEAGQARIKQLRQQHAGDAAMQQRLSVDDRYWQGREMARENPLAALGALMGSVPYDAAKLAYFNGPAPVRKGLEQLTERLFPGEGFNPKTTSRPSTAQYKAYTHGMTEGTYQKMAGALQDMWENGAVPTPVGKVGRTMTRVLNKVPTLADALVALSGAPDSGGSDGKVTLSPLNNATYDALAKAYDGQQYGARLALAHAMDPVGTGFKVARSGLQTLVPQFDTREVFEDWTVGSNGPGPAMRSTRPMKPMTPAQKQAQNMELGRIMRNWDRVP